MTVLQNALEWLEVSTGGAILFSFPTTLMPPTPVRVFVHMPKAHAFVCVPLVLWPELFLRALSCTKAPSTGGQCNCFCSDCA